jgi:hypothetical protein
MDAAGIEPAQHSRQRTAPVRELEAWLERNPTTAMPPSG